MTSRTTTVDLTGAVVAATVDADDEVGVRWWEGDLLPTLPADRSVHHFDEIGRGRRRLVLVELNAVAAVDSVVSALAPPPRASSATLRSYRATAANVDGADGLGADGFLFAVQVRPRERWVEPLRRWLHDEHFHRQLKTSGMRWSLGFESLQGPLQFLNLWGIDRVDVPASEEYAAIRDTPGYRAVLEGFQTAHTDRRVYSRQGSETSW